MSECRAFQQLLEEVGLAALPASLQIPVADHLAECADCQAALDRSVLLDVAVASGLSSALAPVQGRTKLFELMDLLRIRPVRFATAGVGLCAAVFCAAWFGYPVIEAWRFPGGDAAPIRDQFELRGLEEVTKSTVATPRRIGPWTVSQNQAPGFASLDSKVTHLGGQSIKLVQRSGSGYLERRVSLPLPAGTNVICGAWILAPRGGSPDNKYLTMTLKPGDGIGKSDTFDLDASPNWRPIILRTTLDKAVKSFSLQLGVSGGYGRYTGWDWKTWVDDVFVGVMIPLKGSFEERNGSLIVDAKLPSGFTASMLDRKEIWFTAYDSRARNIPGRVLPPPAPDTIRIAIDSEKAVTAMHTSNQDTGGPPTAGIAARLDYKRFSVPVEISLLGRPLDSTRPLRTAPGR